MMTRSSSVNGIFFGSPNGLWTASSGVNFNITGLWERILFIETEFFHVKYIYNLQRVLYFSSFKVKKVGCHINEARLIISVRKNITNKRAFHNKGVPWKENVSIPALIRKREICRLTRKFLALRGKEKLLKKTLKACISALPLCGVAFLISKNICLITSRTKTAVF